MNLQIESINHVCIVVKDLSTAEDFYIGVLGLTRHHKVGTWLVLNDVSTLHLVNIPEAEATSSLYHEVQHFALQVPNLNSVLAKLLQRQIKVFQMDFEGNEHEVVSTDDPLDFGIGTLFARDPDGNLVEFLQIGRGLFKGEHARNDTAR